MEGKKDWTTCRAMSKRRAPQQSYAIVFFFCPLILQVVSKLKGHSKKVNAVLFHPQADANGLVITGTPHTDPPIHLRPIPPIFHPIFQGAGPLPCVPC